MVGHPAHGPRCLPSTELRRKKAKMGSLVIGPPTLSLSY